MKYLGRKEHEYREVDTVVKVTPLSSGNSDVYLFSEDGLLLNTEPICTIYTKFHPWFFDWLRKKFEEDRNVPKTT